MTEGLFEEPKPTPWVLSTLHDNPQNRGRARYVKYSGKYPCDECAAVQWEQRDKGMQRTRLPAAMKRLGPEEDLYLCYTHVRLWEERDKA